MSAGFRALQVVALGVSPITFAVYELAFQIGTLFHHSNVRLSLRIERFLNLVVVTPRMHGIHHSEVRRENNSNFSVVFPWWDRLHRTLRLNVPQSKIVIGIPAYPGSTENKPGRALLMPIRRQRDYWRRHDGTRAERNPLDTQAPLSRMEP